MKIVLIILVIGLKAELLQVIDYLSSCANVTQTQICDPSCAQNCLICYPLGSCVACKPGYYLAYLTQNCEQCPNDCEECLQNGNLWESSLICNQRFYFLDTAQTLQICPPTCQICDSTTLLCKQCLSGYYFYNQTCLSCPANCDNCYNSFDCQQCSKGYYLNQNGKCQVCSDVIQNCISCFYGNHDGAIIDQSIFSNQTQQLDQIEALNLTLMCSKCTSNTVLSPNLTLCYACQDCYCGFVSSHLLVFPLYPLLIVDSEPQCINCQPSQYLKDNKCIQCDFECQYGCSEYGCLICVYGYANTIHGCISCSILTMIPNCGSCYLDDVGAWSCYGCLPGTYLNLNGGCNLCEDFKCSQYDRLYHINYQNDLQNYLTDQIQFNQQYWYLCSMTNETLQNIENPDSFFASIVNLSPTLSFCQFCPIGCLRCSYNPLQIFGDCGPQDCQVNYSFVNGKCIRFDSSISIYTCKVLNLTVELNQVMDDLEIYFNSNPYENQVMNQKIIFDIVILNLIIVEDVILNDLITLESDNFANFDTMIDVLSIKALNPASKIYCNTSLNCFQTIDFGFVYISNISLIHLLVKEVFPSYFFAIFLPSTILQMIYINQINVSQNYTQNSSLCRGLLYISNQNKNSHIQLNFQNVTFQNISIKTSLGALIIQSHFVFIQIGFIKFENSNLLGGLIDLGGSNRNLKITDVIIINSIINGTKLLSFKSGQLSYAFIQRFSFQHVQFVDSQFLKIQNSTQQICNTQILDISLFRTIFISSQLISNTDSSNYLSLFNLSIDESDLDLGDEGVITSTNFRGQQIRISSTFVKNGVFLRSFINGFSQANYLIEVFVLKDCLVWSSTILYSQSSQQKGLLTFQNIYLLIKDLIINNLSTLLYDNAQYTQQLQYSETSILNIQTCLSCIIILNNVQIIFSPSTSFGTINSIQYFEMKNITFQSQLQFNPQEISQVQSPWFQNVFLQLSATQISFYNVTLLQIQTSASILQIMDVQYLDITQLYIGGVLFCPFSNLESPSIVAIQTQQSVQFKLLNVALCHNKIQFNKDLILALKFVSFMLQIMAPYSNIQLQTVQLLNNSQYIPFTQNAYKYVNYVLPTCYLMAKNVQITKCTFTMNLSRYDIESFRYFILKTNGLDANQLLQTLESISSGLIIIDAFQYIKIQKCQFINVLSSDFGVLSLTSRNVFQEVHLSQSIFQNIYSIQDSPILRLQNMRSQVLNLTIQESVFNYIFGFEKGLFDIDTSYQVFNLLINASTFQDIISVQSATLFDINAYQSNNVLIQQQNPIDFSFRYRIRILKLILSQNFRSIVNYHEDMSFSRDQKTSFINVNQVIILIQNAQISEVYYTSDWMIFQNSLVKLDKQITRDSLWKGTLLYLENCQSILNQYEFQDVRVCQSNCKNEIQAFSKNLNPFSQISPKINMSIFYKQETNKNLILQKQNQLFLHNSRFIGVYCNYCSGALLNLLDISVLILKVLFSHLTINNSVIKLNNNNRTTLVNQTIFLKTTSLMTVNQLSGTLRIENTQFRQNVATLTQIFCVNSQNQFQFTNLYIFQSIFTSNIGFQLGAILVIRQTNSPANCLVRIRKCSFSYNTGKISGVILSKSVYPSLAGNHFFQNTGRSSHNDILSPPFAMQFFYKGAILDNNQLFPNKVVSSLKNSIEYPINVGFIQQNKEILRFNEMDEHRQRNILLLVNYGESSYQYTHHDKQFIYLDKLIIVGKPNSVVEVHFFSPIIGVNKGSKLKFKIRECTYGEVYQKMDLVCISCNYNTYSLTKNTCYQCPEQGICEVGTQLFLRPGYWREDFFSSTILECSNKPINCVGDYNNSLNEHNFTTNRFCLNGTIGPLCETCDIQGSYWHGKYMQSAKYECTLCQSLKNHLVSTILILLWTLLSIFLSVYSIISDVRRDLQSQYLRKLGFIYGNINDISRQKSCLYKIILYHFQILSLVFTFGIQSPQFLDYALSAVSNQLRHIGYSIDCFIANNFNLKLIPIIYLKNLASFVFPFGLYLTFFVFYLLIILLNKHTQRRYLNWTAFFFINLLFQPQILQIILQTIACRSIGGKDYVLADVTQICHSQSHLFYLLTIILPGLMFYEVFLPGLVGCILVSNKSQLDKIRIKFKYGFIYYEYRPKAYYWEMVKILKRMLIFFGISFLDNQNISKGAMILALLEVYIIVCQYIKPYVSLTITKIDLYSQYANFTTILLTMVLVSSYNDVYLIIYIVILTIINFLWMFIVAKDVALNYLKKDMRRKIYVMKDKLDLWRQSRRQSNSALFLKTHARLERILQYIGNLFASKNEIKTLKIWARIRMSFNESIRQQVPLHLKKPFKTIMHENFMRSNSEAIRQLTITCRSLRHRKSSLEPQIKSFDSQDDIVPVEPTLTRATHSTIIRMQRI